jgi:hypothetical protein
MKTTNPLFQFCLGALLSVTTATVLIARDDPITDPGWNQPAPFIPPGDTRNCPQSIAHCTQFTTDGCRSTAGDASLSYCTLGGSQIAVTGGRLVADRPLGTCQNTGGGGTGCGEMTDPECARLQLYGSRQYIGEGDPATDTDPTHWLCSNPQCYKVIYIIGSYCYP